MNTHYTPRSKFITGVALIVAGAVVVASWDSGGEQFALFAAIVAYTLFMVGLVVVTVRMYRAGGHRTRWAMGLALGAFAVIGLIASATADVGQGVVFILQMVIAMIVVDAVVGVAALRRRWQHP